MLLTNTGMNFIFAEHDLINGQWMGIINVALGFFLLGMWFQKWLSDDLSAMKDSLMDVYRHTIELQHNMILRRLEDRDAGDWWKENE